jgi:hypothetical protein
VTFWISWSVAATVVLMGIVMATLVLLVLMVMKAVTGSVAVAVAATALPVVGQLVEVVLD